MTIPATVLKVLDDWHVNYQLTDDEDTFHLMQAKLTTAYSAQVAHVVFLKDTMGQVQVVIPSNRILDLNRLSQQTGRQFSALSVDELLSLKQKHGIADFPALPQVTQIDSLVDEHLLAENELFIISGDNHEWLKIPGEEFKALTTSSTLGCYTSPLPVAAVDRADDLDDIHAAVRQFTPHRIQQRLEDTLDIPPLPETARKIIEFRIDPSGDTAELARIVGIDPGMAAQVVSWARSPYYGAKGEVSTVEEAVIRVLGFDLVINLALGLALGRSLAIPKQGPNGYAHFWQQAIVTATLMTALARLMPANQRPNIGTAYLCGLLHNFGFLILGHVFPPQFDLINRHIEANPHISRSLIEQHIIGLCREQASSRLMEQWNMPDEVVEALRQQHSPSETEGLHSCSRLLYVAVRCLRLRGFGDGPWEQPDQKIFDALGIEAQEAYRVTESTLERLDELEDLVKMLDQQGPA